jgi:glycosyltransferase involved in cell wall biosynthesis
VDSARATLPRPVRVCFLIDELATAGTETQLLALIRHLDRSRVLPHLVLLRGDNPASRALEPADCPVLRLQVGSLGSPAALMHALRFIRYLRRERIDILQVYFPDSSYFGLPAAWLSGVKYRLRTRNNIGHWLTPLHRLLGRALNVLTTATIANCEAARRALLAAEKPSPESVVVLENGVDLDRFLGLDLPRRDSAEQPACVGVVANLRPVKGLDVLIAALAHLKGRFPELKVLLGGEGEQRSALEAQVRAAGLDGIVEFPGRILDVPGFLAGLDIAVLPSRAEGMSNALLEYMAAARPIIATAVGATPDLIEDGLQGLLVPPEDPVTLAHALRYLLSQPERARQLGEVARQKALERFSRPAMVRRFEEFYLRLLHGPGWEGVACPTC